MNDRFTQLEIEMVRRGVALRHARRAALELDCHHRDLIEQALARGDTPEEAKRSAHEALGTDALLIERYLHQKELRGWAYRWRAVFLIAPLLGFMTIVAAEIGLLVLIVSHLPAQLRHMRVPDTITHGMNDLVRLSCLWVIPVAVAIAFGAVANRHRIAFRWPFAGILLLAVFASLMNVSFIITGGSPSGVASAGLGVSASTLPGQLLHALDTAALALIPVGWLRYRMSPRSLSLG